MNDNEAQIKKAEQLLNCARSKRNMKKRRIP